MKSDFPVDAVTQPPSASPHWSPLPGVVIEAEIGRGGMGVVYRARQTFLDRQVALKLLLSERFADGDVTYAARFNREARILASLHHPNIAACHEAGVTAGGIPYLLMELVEGPSLGSWLAEHGRLPLAHALEMAMDLAGALAHAKEKGIIHRDVKPDNVLLATRRTGEQRVGSSFPWTVKLIDLGIARPSGAGISVTQPGLVVGTPIMMAPEQFRQPDTIDWRVDLYGLGCVLYQSLTGAPPFSSSSIVELITTKISSPAPDPSTVVRDLPTGVVQLVRELLDPDPECRPGSYAILSERCRLLLGQGTTTSLPPQSLLPLQSPQSKQASRSHVPGARLVLVGLGLALLVGGGTWYARTSRPQQATPPAAAPTVSSVPPERPPTPVGPAVNLLSEAFAGMPGWDMSGGEAASDEDSNCLVLGRGVIRHALPPLPCIFTIDLNRPRPDVIPGATTIGVTLADGRQVGVVLADLGGQVLVRTLGAAAGATSAPILTLNDAPTHAVTMLVAAHGVWFTADGQTLVPLPLPAPPVSLVIGHTPAAGASASAVALRKIHYQ